MKANKQENQVKVGSQGKERSGFIANVMPVMGKTGEYVYFFLPGEMTITENANRFKALLGISYTPKSKAAQRPEYQPRAGLHAKVRIGLSEDGQWVTLYLPGSLGKICNHVNAYKHIFGIEYTRRAQPAST